MARFAAVIGVIAAVLCIGVASAGAAVTRQVSTAGSDSGDCVVAACATIQYAVGQASAGDTIEVGPGTYAAGATVNKALTLRGAQAGVDARTRSLAPSQESVIASSGTAFTLPNTLAGAVTIDGFEITPSGANVSGVAMQGGSGHIVRNDIFAGIADGAAAKGIFNAASFEHNRVEGSKIGFESNTQPGNGTTIEANLFKGTSNWDVSFVQGGTGVRIADNRRTGVGGNYLLLQKTTGAEVSGNVADGIDAPGLFVGGGTSETEISGNEFVNLTPEPGIIFASLGSNGANQGAVVTGNTLVNDSYGIYANGTGILGGEFEVHSNRIAGNTVGGIINGVGSGAPIDASDNWWGCNAGPTTDASTECDTIAGEGVIADPWLVLSAAATPSLLTGQSATVVAALGTDSDGLPAGPAPDGTPVGFATDLGSLSAASGALAGGSAATLLGSATAGLAHVLVSVDAQSLTVPVQFDSPPLPTPPAPPPPVVAPPSPPKIEPAGDGSPKTVSDNGTVTVAKISCASSSCAVEAKSPKVTIGGKSYKIKVKVPAKISAGGSAPVKVILSKRTREALEEEGKGRVRVKLRITSADGATKTVNVTVVLKARQHKGKDR
ncbi:MAG: right-handed parallel beta-helix repeat-containing protein [Solirubrobacterales bacterium]